MKKKLNLTIDEDLLKIAKKVSQREKISLSQLFETWVKQYSTNILKQDWLEGYYQRNQKNLNQLTDEKEQELLNLRGNKWK